MNWTIISEKPIVKRRMTHGTPEGLCFQEERMLEGDTGYDANVRDRLMSMAKGAGVQLVDRDGRLLVERFPPFHPHNRLRITVEILPPEEAVPETPAKPAVAAAPPTPVDEKYAELDAHTKAELRAACDQVNLPWLPKENKDVLIKRLLGRE
jgi:hypothetical protein